ncbi:mechanosensitive ion channel family protein [Pseudoalteromonas piratica]|nr:mechanosensitive ion channel domain-containing protein [Pseudoalteromonas piratica]
MKCVIWRSLFVCFMMFLGSAVAEPKTDVTVKDLLELEEVEQAAKQTNEINAFVGWDTFGRETPKSSMQGFLSAARQQDYQTASEYLDFRNLPFEVTAASQPEIARQLHVSLDRTLWVDIEGLSNDLLGKLPENVPDYRDLVGTIETPEGTVPVLLQRVPTSENKRIWKISNATVAKIPVLDKYYGYSEMGEWLSQHLPNYRFMGVMLWQWLYFAVTFLLYIVASCLSYWVLIKLFNAFKIKLSFYIDFLYAPLSFLTATLLTRNFSDTSNVTFAVKAVAEASTILIFAWLWFLWRTVELVKSKLTGKLVAQGKTHTTYLLRPAANVVKSLLVIAAVLIWLENLGFSATTIMAGLGIGGLAVALAAQKSVENLIGAITLYSSTPVKVGNLCRIGKFIGTVEEIGLRATRVRTIERTVVYIANAKFIDMEIENFSEREKMAFRPKLLLEMPQSNTQLSEFNKALKALLEQHELIDESPCRVYFKGFSPFAVELYVLSYITSTDFETYLKVSDTLHFEIMNLLHQHKLKLAAPELLQA